MAAAARETRSRAIQRNETAAFALDLEARVYRGGRTGATHAIPPDLSLTVIAKTNSTDERIRSIDFFPDGSSSGGRITLTRNGSIHEITVDWLTGRVSIRE